MLIHLITGKIWLRELRINSRVEVKKLRGFSIATAYAKDYTGTIKLFSVDLVNMDTCRNQLLLEDIRQYGREI